MEEQSLQPQSVEVKARLLRCRRCNGWVYVEHDPFAQGSWAVCVNCGWEEELMSTDPLSPGVVSKLGPKPKVGGRTGYHRRVAG